MAKYQVLTKYGEVEVGLHMYRKVKDGFGPPWKVISLYIQSGTGIMVVSKAKLTDQIVYGSRASVHVNDAELVYQIQNLNYKEFYINLEAPFGVELEDATSTMV
jgi:hypothetical protein